MRFTSPRWTIQQSTVDAGVAQDAGLCVSVCISKVNDLRYSTFDVVLELNIRPSELDIP